MDDEDKCHETYQNAQLCVSYFNEEFNKVRTNFIPLKEELLEKIKSIQDPILRYVALYLVDNFEKAKKYFRKNGTAFNNIACQMLNRWLDQRKSFYTYGEKCTANVDLWEKTIYPIWKMLNKNESNKCARVEIYAKYAYIPEALGPPMCYKYVPENYNCTLPLKLFKINLDARCNEIDKKCSECKKMNYLKEFIPSEEYTVPVTCPSTEAYKSYSSAEPQRSCGFTPLGVKLSNGDREKKNPWQQLIEEEEDEEEFEGFRNNSPYSRDERSQLHYQYMEN